MTKRNEYQGQMDGLFLAQGYLTRGARGTYVNVTHRTYSIMRKFILCKHFRWIVKRMQRN